MIGYTARTGAVSLARHAQYEFQYLVVIADKLTMDDALNLEGILRDRCLENPKHLTCKKYVESRKKRRRIRSWGGTNRRNALHKIHSVYMVWWDE